MTFILEINIVLHICAGIYTFPFGILQLYICNCIASYKSYRILAYGRMKSQPLATDIYNFHRAHADSPRLYNKSHEIYTRLCRAIWCVSFLSYCVVFFYDIALKKSGMVWA